MEIKDSNILVTGGCGFIGRHLVRELLKHDPRLIMVVDNCFLYKMTGHPLPIFRDERVLSAPRDAGDYNKMKVIFDEYDIDMVFNLAVMPLPHSLEHPTENFNNNMRIVTTLLDLLRESKYKKLIHFSSSEVYGSCRTAPMKEDHRIAPSTAYAASKAAGDMLVGSAYRVSKLPVVTIRPFNNYGPEQNENTYAAVIPRTISRLMQGMPAQIFGDGSQTRDYIFVEDTCRAAIEVAQSGDHLLGQVFNVASGTEIRIKDLIIMIVDLFGRMKIENIVKLPNIDWSNIKIEYLPGRPGDIVRHIGDTMKIETMIGFKTYIGFYEGLRRTIEWRLKEGR